MAKLLELITSYINPPTILIFILAIIVICVIGMMYVIFCKNEQVTDDEEKWQQEKMIMLKLREEEIENFNRAIDRKFAINPPSKDEGAVFVGVDPYDEVDFSKLNIKIDIEDDDMDDLIDFKHLAEQNALKAQQRNSKKKRKLFWKGTNKAQMNTIREAAEESTESIALEIFPPSNSPSDENSSHDTSLRSSGPGSSTSESTLSLSESRSTDSERSERKKSSCSATPNPQLQVKQVNKEQLDNDRSINTMAGANTSGLNNSYTKLI